METVEQIRGALRAASALATCCMAQGCYSHDELAEMARATKSTFDAALALLPSGIAEAWQPTETAPYDEVVRVKVGGMTMLAKLLYHHSENEYGSCDQWVAANEGEHPPCWSGGACWESNEDEVTSLQPTAWRPEPPRALDLSNMGDGE